MQKQMKQLDNWIEKEAFKVVRLYYAHNRNSEAERIKLKNLYTLFKKNLYYNYDKSNVFHNYDKGYAPKWIYRFIIDVEAYLDYKDII